MDSVKEQTITSVKWTAIEKLGLWGMQFVLGIIMARLLAPEDYGTIGMIGIFLAISNTFIDGGLGCAVVRKQNCTHTDYCTVFYFNIVVAAFFYAVLFLAAPLIADFFHTPILKAIVRVQSINFLINSLMQVQVAQLRKDLDFKALAKCSMIATLFSGIIGICFAYLGFGVWALVFQGIISTLINLIYIWLYSKWRPSLIFSWNSFKELGGFGSRLLAASLLNTVYDNMTTLVIGRYYSAKDLGNYNRGTSLASMPVDAVCSTLMKVTFPILTKIQDDSERLIAVYRKYIKVMSIPIFFGCMLLISISKPVIIILLTEKWLPAVPYLVIYAFSVMFSHISVLNLNLLQVKGYSDIFLKLEVIKKTISFVILFASIPFGVIGICISKVIYTQIAMYINTYYTGKLFNLGYLTQLKDFSGYLIKSIVSCLPMFLVNTFSDIPPVAGLIIGIFLSVVLFYFLIRKDENFVELLQMASIKLPFLNKII